MNRTLAAALILASSISTAAPVLAQDGRMIQATVPFSFAVGNVTLSAGTYTIRSNRTEANLLSLSDSHKGVGIFAMGLPHRGGPGKADVLVFHKYGDSYFLTQIRAEDASMNVDFLPSKAEKRARTQVEEAGRFVDDPVLVALNR